MYNKIFNVCFYFFLLIVYFFQGGSQFYLCHYPFLFDAFCKIKLLEMDQAMQMQEAMNEAASLAIQSLFMGGHPPPQYVTLQVSRENIVADTLRELAKYGTSDLKKPLKVIDYLK